MGAVAGGGAEPEKLAEALECARSMEIWNAGVGPADGLYPKLAPDDPMLHFFTYDHLPLPMQAASRSFCELAFHIVATLPRNPERTVALRKLLEAKDCAIRAMIFK